MRFLVPLLCLGSGSFRIDGVPRMRERPIGPLLDALAALGADARGEGAAGYPPVLVQGRGGFGGEATMRGDISSQFFTGLMLAAPATGRTVRVAVVGEMVSKPYIATTADVMRSFGAATEVSEAVDSIVIPGGQRYVGRDYRVEPDATAASYFLAAAAITGGRVRIPGLGTASNQGDLDFVRVLERMGCAVSRSERELAVEGPSVLSGVDADFTDIPDTFMTLAAIAPLASGPVVIRGIAPTRAKESDRPAAMARELRRLGADVEETEDSLTIQPGLRGGATVQTYDDHRVAMSFAVLGLRAPGVVIADPGCVAKTFPRFFDRLEELAVPARSAPRA